MSKKTPGAAKAMAAVVGQHDGEPSVQKRALVGIAQNAARGLDKALYGKDRRLSLALTRITDEVLDELPEAQRTATARTLAWSIALTRLRRDTLNGVLLELGPRIVNRTTRRAYPLLEQLNGTERLLADLLRQWHELRFDTDLEARIEALEEGSVINGAT